MHPVTHAQYEAMLVQANAQTVRVERPIDDALYGGAFTVTRLRQELLAAAANNTRLGRRFATVAPPEAAARRANARLAKAELDLGVETRALAAHLPRAKAKVAKYLADENAQGETELTKAVAALRLAGYRPSG
jgi:hypothetical protein